MKKGRDTFYNFVFLRHWIWFKDMMQTAKVKKVVQEKH